MALKVVAECVDKRTGARYAPGPGVFFPDDAPPEQVDRLIGSGCLKRVSAKDLTADEKRGAQSTRAAAEAELAAIERTLAEARDRRDRELVEITDKVSEARRLGDQQIADINAKVEEARVAAQTDPAEIARQQVNEDKLFDNTVEQLREIAEKEKVDLAGASRKDDIVAAIRAKRAAALGA